MIDNDLFTQAIAEATAKGKTLLNKKKEQLKTDRKSVLDTWKASQKKRREEEHEAQVRSGKEITDAFIQEVAGPFLRMCSDPKTVESLGNLRIMFVPGKSDQASTTSVVTLDGGKRISTDFKARLQQLSDKEIRLTEKLQKETAFAGTTPIDMLEEIKRLQNISAALTNEMSRLSSIAAAAQELLMARVEDKDLEESLEKLESAFKV